MSGRFRWDGDYFLSRIFLRRWGGRDDGVERLSFLVVLRESPGGYIEVPSMGEESVFVESVFDPREGGEII